MLLGTNIRVLQGNDDEELDLVTELSNLSFDGKRVTAKAAQLHEQDGKMLILSDR